MSVRESQRPRLLLFDLPTPRVRTTFELQICRTNKFPRRKPLQGSIHQGSTGERGSVRKGIIEMFTPPSILHQPHFSQHTSRHDHDSRHPFCMKIPAHTPPARMLSQKHLCITSRLGPRHSTCLGFWWWSRIIDLMIVEEMEALKIVLRFEAMA